MYRMVIKVNEYYYDVDNIKNSITTMRYYEFDNRKMAMTTLSILTDPLFRRDILTMELWNITTKKSKLVYNYDKINGISEYYD